MNNIIKFLDIHYENALKLVSDFDITKSKAWDPQIYLNELYVQLGHVYNVLFANENVNETKRKIDNLGDELSDVLLQLINLAKIMNIDMYEIKKYEDYDYHDISGISILLGQLTEAIMENNDCRFKKDRVGFDTSYDFVKDRLFKLFIITYNISLDYKLDIIKEFDDMLKDANGFLDRFRKGNNKVHEYIDIYDSKENLLGYCEKTKATATIVMALGVSRMAKKNALVKKLPAVEALGSATVICSDKTGTLTLNKMTVVKSTLYSDIINKNDLNTFNDDLIKCSCLCNNAYIDKDKVIGDPTEGCLLTYAKNNGYDIKDIKSNKVLYEQAFDSIRKRMSAVIKDKKGYLVYCKGAPEELIDVCSYACVDDKLVKLTSEDKDKIKDYCVTMSSKGLRLLGFAMKNIKTLPKEGDMIEEDLTFIGIMGIIDPPRVEVKHAINTCHEAGIRVIMITGDHKLTARAIAKDLGIYKKGDLVVDGETLSKMSDLKLRNTIKDISVFARVTPQDKLRIVNALKKNKEIVAMTGDGVNDAPALKKADIGVAMGITGTDVAKDAAAMILLDDNFTTIEAAVKEGRRVYRNIQKVIQYLLAGNIAEVLTIFVSMLFNLPSPLLAVHILFINLVTDTLPSLALGIDPASPNVMKHKPVKEGSLFERGLVFRIGFYGVFLAIITLVAYFIGQDDSYNVGMTMAFTVLCLSQIFHSLNQSSSITSLFSKDYPRNKMLFLSMVGSIFFLMIVLFVTPIREFFSLSVLSGNEWLIVILLSLSPILIVEIFKAIKRSIGMDS